MGQLTVKQRLDQHDKQIAAIRKLIHDGMRLVLESRRESDRAAAQLRKELRELAAAQKKTEESLKAFINSMRGGGNGHSKRRVDLQ